MHSLLLLAALAAVPPPTPLTLAVPGFAGAGLEPEELSYCSEFFGSQLRLQGVRVVAPRHGEARAIDGIVLGKLARFGQRGMLIDLRVVRASTAEVVAARSVTAGNDTELFELLRRAAQELSIELFHALGRQPVPQAKVELPARAAQGAPSPVPGYVAAGAGLLAGGAGAALIAVSQVQLSNVARGGPSTWAAAQAQANGARSMATPGIALAAAGAVIAVAGLAYAVAVARKSEGGLAVAPYLGPGQGGLSLAGALP